MTFKQLGLCPPILQALSEQAYSSPTEIQAQAIPAVLSGRDVLATAPTGTGKTASFVLPLLQRLQPDPASSERKRRAPQNRVALSVAPAKPNRWTNS